MDEAEEQALVAQPLVRGVAEQAVELWAYRKRRRLLPCRQEIRDDREVLGQRAVLRRLVRPPLLRRCRDDARARAEPARRGAGDEPRRQRNQRDRRLVEEEELEREAGGGGDDARDETSERPCEHRDEDADRGEDGGLVPVAERHENRCVDDERKEDRDRGTHARPGEARDERRSRTVGGPWVHHRFPDCSTLPDRDLPGRRARAYDRSAIVGRGNRWQ